MTTVHVEGAWAGPAIAWHPTAPVVLALQAAVSPAREQLLRVNAGWTF